MKLVKPKNYTRKRKIGARGEDSRRIIYARKGTEFHATKGWRVYRGVK